MRSSYKENNYGDFFAAFSKIHQPKLIVEVGVLDGYSLISLAKGLSENGKIIGIDLFDDYEFKHGTYDAVSSAVLRSGLSQKVELIKGDAIKMAEMFDDNTIDILHIDISNDGANLKQVFNLWYWKIKEGGYFIFEGGSKERDNIEWMTRHNKEKIESFKSYLSYFLDLEILTLQPFPSLTICRIAARVF